MLTDRGPRQLQLALATFAVLALELAFIRWTAGQIRIFAYFHNVTMLAAFLGLGLGLGVARRHPALVHLALPVFCAVVAVLAFSERLGLMHLPFPDPSIHLWGAEIRSGERGTFAYSLAAFVGIFVLLAGGFLCAGTAVGRLFAELPPLRAYRWDLCGSLAGIVAFSALTSVAAPPALWFALGVIPILWLSRTVLSAASAAGIIALAWLSGAGATYSPYNRIDLEQDGSSVKLSVNRDFHQFMHDLSDGSLATAAGPSVQRMQGYRLVYDLPFLINDRRQRALIVGAGTGNDVQAALRLGYGAVYSVDIDGSIIALGRALHPERPYADARVVPVVNDARAFFEQYEGEPFDVVAFGLLDSHAMFTSLASLRLDNYVYTREGLRAAWAQVGEGGHLSVNFSVFAGRWIADRLYWTITEATGTEPVMLCHGMHYGCTFVVGRSGATLHLERARPIKRGSVSAPASAVSVTSDDWPFLYIRPGVFPWGYSVLLAAVLAITAVAIPPAFGGRRMLAAFDPGLFLMGAAFLLIEARSITTLSLLFGSTWIVNAATFAGVIVMALVGNEIAIRFAPARLDLWFVALFATIGVVWLAPYGSLNVFPLGIRWVLGGLLHALPIGVAGVIVSVMLQRASDPSAALGSNLLGSVVGGCLEYLGMLIGLQMLLVVALGLYGSAWLAWLRSERRSADRVTSRLPTG